ncbi:hypothetical protein CW304_05150 [Bacillus sp. UFRGS-B20]|nr:hypothetical protein CW304_05150 [Bacillus sp. UFRGS-B20]
MKGNKVEKGDYYNFEALNLPERSPSADIAKIHSTLQKKRYYVTQHLSCKHVRWNNNKEKGQSKFICPGKVYRRDDDDATHSHQFMQIEVL